ncbi:MAG: MotA/TolQ/ExbB proton channel family protein [Prolixibacteraceae bacterium]|jgi:biopolymer transport protein ExbB/TolQ|nr:MotA/TolQ/ExbB proton channel family protein [Prolixibacteraceae bacterium]
MKALFHIANDGGPLFTYVILLFLLVIIVLFVTSLLDKGKSLKKTIELLKSLGWFALVWGFLGSNIGLITTFDRIEAAGDIAPYLLAEGLKMALVGPLFGIIVFSIARALIITLIIKSKETDF